MEKPTIKAKKRLLLFLFCSMCGYLLLTGRLVFIELFRAEELQELAYEQQTRDRLITPKRGAILDRNRGRDCSDGNGKRRECDSRAGKGKRENGAIFGRNAGFGI